MTTTEPLLWRNRIVGHGELSPEEIVSNPLNWRAHPDNQREAMQSALAELGWLEEVRINKRTGFCLDGHMRVGLAHKHHQPKVPVTYLDLTPEEERKALLTINPLAAMAQANKDNLERLLQQTSFESPALKQLTEGLAKQYKVAIEQSTDALAAGLAQANADTTPQNYQEQYGVLVLCADEIEQASIYAKLQAQGYEHLKVVST